MKELEFFYQNRPKLAKFLSRKQAITEPFCQLYGASGSGKSTLMIEHLSHFKDDESLYFSLKDLRLDTQKTLLDLPDFLKQNPQIKALYVDDISSDDELNALAWLRNDALKSVVLGTQARLSVVQGFSELRLGYLDYEEFLAFYSKNIDESFSQFLERGGGMEAAFLSPFELASKAQSRLRANLDAIDIKILVQCAKNCASTLSVLAIYSELKQELRLSKDRLYASFLALQNRGYIATLAKLDEPNASKKIFFNDFSLRDRLVAKKDFLASFKNMIFCELAKLNDEIYYTKDFDFVLLKRKTAILCMPFTQPEIIFLKFKKLHKILKSLGLNRLQIISVAHAGTQSNEGIKCEIVPFSQWALGL
ncbi:ATP-binding protein [Campylobacter sp. 19-13652]|uniref:ATP-binding protein n=1 Tax=Campylobacter sp. 19-13652 TaxID=2840180 RepID=UPI001C772936|nr:ATP-binding protein [Campylobacter sp. 19-13652]BCX80254.1 hypothetical protein LBC_17160 [Campylobacter sp. 19-13652]